MPVKPAKPTKTKTAAKKKIVVKKTAVKKAVLKIVKKKPVVKKKAKQTFANDVMPVPERKKKKSFRGYVFDPTDKNVDNYLRAHQLKPENFVFIINRLVCGKTLAETLVSYKEFVPSTKMMMETIRRIEIRFDYLIKPLRKKREKYLKEKLIKVTKHNKKSDRKRKPPPQWKIDMMKNIGPDGLPELPQSMTTRPDYTTNDMPIDKLFQALSRYSKPELRHIIKHRFLDGQSLSMQSMSLAQCYLDTLNSNPKVRHQALKYIIDRRYGTLQQRIANGDGTNFDAFAAVINPDLARLKPTKS